MREPWQNDPIVNDEVESPSAGHQCRSGNTVVFISHRELHYKSRIPKPREIPQIHQFPIIVVWGHRPSDDDLTEFERIKREQLLIFALAGHRHDHIR